MEIDPLYQIERLDALTRLDALEEEWAELIARIPDVPVFLTWEWIRTWWFYYGRDHELWLLTARDKQGTLLGLAPLMRELHNTGWMKLRIISFIGAGRDIEVHNDILTDTIHREALSQAFLAFLFNLSDQWDAIWFASVAPKSGLHSLIPTVVGRVRTGVTKKSVYITLPGNWETYRKTLTRKLRRNLKYFRSKLEDDYPGGVSFACVTDPRELPGAMKKLEEFSKYRWHKKGRISNFDDPKFPVFHQAMARLALDRGWLRLYQFKVCEHVIAICYNFRFHDRVHAYAIGFDLEWSRYSPGRLAIADSIQASIQEGMHEYDWGAGDHAYKFQWTDQVREEKELLFSHNWRGGIWIEWRGFKEVLLTRGRQWLPQATRDRINRFLSPRHKKTEDRDNNDAR